MSNTDPMCIHFRTRVDILDNLQYEGSQKISLDDIHAPETMNLNLDGESDISIESLKSDISSFPANFDLYKCPGCEKVMSAKKPPKTGFLHGDPNHRIIYYADEDCWIYYPPAVSYHDELNKDNIHIASID